MSISDDILMAFADGELDREQSAAIEVAMQNDPSIAARVAQHQALRLQVQAAFAPILEEEIPAKLKKTLSQSDPVTTPEINQREKVVSLAELNLARKNRRDQSQTNAQDRLDGNHPRRERDWRDWGGLAAMLVVGLWLGQSSLFNRDLPTTLVTANENGQLIANGKLTTALDTQLSNEHKGSEVQIGLSFKSKDGQFCRSFSAKQSNGVACHQSQTWAIALMVDSASSSPDRRDNDAYRPAGSETSPVILDFIDQNIAGTSLNQAEEKAALLKAWK